MRRKILSDKENDKVFGLNYSDEELIKEFTIESADLNKVSRINKDWNRLGYILQKYILKSKGYIPNLEGNIPSELVDYICKQIGIDNNVVLSKYSKSTRLHDTKMIQMELGYEKLKLNEDIRRAVFNIVITNPSEYGAMMDLIYYLRLNKIIFSKAKIEKILWDGIKSVEDFIYTRIVEQVHDIGKLESFLDVQVGRFSDYHIVKGSGVKGKEDVLNKISVLKKYDLPGVDLSFIPDRKLQSLYAEILKCTRDKIIRFKDDNKKLAYLVIYIKKTLVVLENELIKIDREEEKNRYNKIEVTERNISRVYKRFVDEVVLKREEYEESILVCLFLDLIIGESDKGDKKSTKGYFIVNGETVYIDESIFKDFVDDIVIGKYTKDEKRKLIEVSDKLKSIENQRKRAEYYTPYVLVDEANKMIEQQLGVDWKNRYIVWDNSAGKGNLSYLKGKSTFKKLYSSDVDKYRLKYVEKGVKFEFDFLNDDIEKTHKIPTTLLKALKEDKPIVFLMNPPYLSSSDSIEVNGKMVATPTTMVGKQMQKMGLTVSSYQLYTQFLYRVLEIKKMYNLSELHIILFSPLTYLHSPKFRKFEEIFLSEFNFKTGYLIPANIFNRVYGKWDISFTIWSSGECKSKDEFLYLQKEVDKDGRIFTREIRILSNKDRV